MESKPFPGVTNWRKLSDINRFNNFCVINFLWPARPAEGTALAWMGNM